MSATAFHVGSSGIRPSWYLQQPCLRLSCPEKPILVLITITLSQVQRFSKLWKEPSLGCYRSSRYWVVL
jgi:hypothetical protein